MGSGPCNTEFDHVKISIIAFLAEGMSCIKIEKVSAYICLVVLQFICSTGTKSRPTEEKIFTIMLGLTWNTSNT